jgi:transposase
MLPPNSAAILTRFPSGVAAFAVSVSPACKTSTVPADPGLFPPEDRHKVLCLATTDPAVHELLASHWSLDDLAYHILRDAHYADMSRSTIQRILAGAELRPHKSLYWLHGDDPDFETKALAICRLYLDAPTLYRHGELVVCVDEKTGIQALERARPTTPAVPGQVERRDYEYIRHGTCCLIASRVVATGQVLGSVTEHRRSWDFVRHIRDVVAAFPEVHKFHWVMDNLNTHFSFELCRYLGKESGGWEDRLPLRTGTERRVFLSDPGHKHVVHYTPRHGSWLNQIEIWFGVLSRRLLRRGDFHSVAELAERITAFITYYNCHLAYPYEWTYTGQPLVGDSKQRRRRLRLHRRRLMTMRSG